MMILEVINSALRLPLVRKALRIDGLRKVSVTSGTNSRRIESASSASLRNLLEHERTSGGRTGVSMFTREMHRLTELFM